MLAHIIPIDERLWFVLMGMVITFIVQFQINRHSNKGRWERAGEAFICQLFTASLSIPLVDYFPQIPPSVTLLIGAIVGTLGVSGWEKIAHSLLSLFFSRLGNNSFDSLSRNPADNKNHSNKASESKDSDSDEPPMPFKRKDK